MRIKIGGSHHLLLLSWLAILLPLHHAAHAWTTTSSVVGLQSTPPTTTTPSSSRHTTRSYARLRTRGGAAVAAAATVSNNNHKSSTDPQPPKDFSSDAAGLFGNIRIPAALFAGASAGAAFALPLGAVGSENFKVALVKRLYALLMMGALSSETVAVVVSTLTLGALSTKSSSHQTTNTLHEFLRTHYDLEWISARLHFLGGVLLFSLAIGMRAWIAIQCPVVARAALGIIMSSILLCLSFWRQLEEESFMDGIVKLPIRYVAALLKRSKQSGFFAVSFAFSVITALYIVWSIPHLLQFLLKANPGSM